LLPESTPDRERLELRFQSNGSVASIRTLLADLDAHAIDVTELSLHTPDLDDVFLALTGSAAAPEVVA
jgi:ABC-2 type transport system ATP-binding protein